MRPAPSWIVAETLVRVINGPRHLTHRLPRREPRTRPDGIRGQIAPIHLQPQPLEALPKGQQFGIDRRQTIDGGPLSSTTLPSGSVT